MCNCKPSEPCDHTLPPMSLRMGRLLRGLRLAVNYVKRLGFLLGVLKEHVKAIFRILASFYGFTDTEFRALDFEKFYNNWKVRDSLMFILKIWWILRNLLCFFWKNRGLGFIYVEVRLRSRGLSRKAWTKSWIWKGIVTQMVCVFTVIHLI